MAKKPQGYTAPDSSVPAPKIPIAPGSSNALGQPVPGQNPPNQTTPNALTIQPDSKPPKGPGSPTKKPVSAKRGGKSPKKDSMLADNLAPPAGGKKPFAGAAPPFKKPPVKEAPDPMTGTHGGLDHDGQITAERRYPARRYGR
jgi:hypothetical protein